MSFYLLSYGFQDSLFAPSKVILEIGGLERPTGMITVLAKLEGEKIIYRPPCKL